MYQDKILHLTTMLGSYPKTTPLKEQRLTAPTVTLDFAPIDVAQTGFKETVRELKYDVSELAIVTFLLALDAGKPYVLLPFVMNGLFHHKSILCRSDDPLTPSGLAGKRVAMRSYSQTTPCWVRGILTDDYGLDPRSVNWLSQEGAHVAEYVDPPWVTPLVHKAELEPLLLAGEVDAIITGATRTPDPRIRTLIPNPHQAALAWHARHGIVPINHMVVVRRELAEQRPDAIREIYDLLCHARAETMPVKPGEIDLQPTGFARVNKALEMIVRFAHDQGLISKPLEIADLFGPVRSAIPD